MPSTWKKYAGINVKLDSITNVIDGLSDKINEINNILNTILSILDVTKNLISIPESENEIIYKALYNGIKQLFDRLRKEIEENINTGFYFLPHYESIDFDLLFRNELLSPTNEKPEGNKERIVKIRDPKNPTRSYETRIISKSLQKRYTYDNFINDIIESFDDPADFSRPIFDTDTKLHSVLIAVSSSEYRKFVILYLIIVFLFNTKEYSLSVVQKLYTIFKAVIGDQEFLGRGTDENEKLKLLEILEKIRDPNLFDNSIDYINFLIKEITPSSTSENISLEAKYEKLSDNLYKIVINSSDETKIKIKIDGILIEQNIKSGINNLYFSFADTFEIENLISIKNDSQLRLYNAIAEMDIPDNRIKASRLAGVSLPLSLNQKNDITKFGSFADRVNIRYNCTFDFYVNSTTKPLLLINGKQKPFPISIERSFRNITLEYDSIVLDQDTNIIQLIFSSQVDTPEGAIIAHTVPFTIVLNRNTGKLGKVTITSSDKAYMYKRFINEDTQNAVYFINGTCDARAEYIYVVIKYSGQTINVEEIPTRNGIFSSPIKLEWKGENTVYNLEVYQSISKITDFSKLNIVSDVVRKNITIINTSKEIEKSILPNWKSMTLNDIANIKDPVMNLVNTLENFFISSIPSNPTFILGQLVDSVKEEINELKELIDTILSYLNNVNSLFNLKSEGMWVAVIKDANGVAGTKERIRNIIVPEDLRKAKFVTGIVLLSTEEFITKLFPNVPSDGRDSFGKASKTPDVLEDIRKKMIEIQTERIKNKEKLVNDVEMLRKQISDI